MSPEKYEFYKSAILSQHPDASEIREPSQPGSQDNILMANTPSGNRVFKFSKNNDLIIKNAKASYLYNIRKIPCPKITPCEYEQVYFENYAKLDGITLYEAIAMGMDAAQIQDVYRDIVELITKMERIYPQNLGRGSMHNAHEIAGAQTSQSHGIAIGQLVKAMIYFANRNTSQHGLYHFDLGPKNIIVSDSGKFSSLIDMDSVGVCSLDFAFGMLVARYKQIGMDAGDLFRFFNTVGASRLNYDAIMNYAYLRQKLAKKQR